MREKTLALVVALVAVQTGTAQIVGPTEVTVAKGTKNVSIEVSVTADSAEYLALGNLEMIREFTRATNKLVIRVLTNEVGNGYVVVAAVKDGSMLPLYRCLVRVIEPGPAPPPGPGPKPPDPGPSPPDPKPPEPIPDAPPFPADSLHVLVVYETATVAELKAGQRAILYSKAVRDMLDAKCGKNYRFFDKDQDASKDTPAFAAAMRVKRDSIPWVVVSNGKTGFSGPLPQTAGEFETLVGRYAK